MARKFTAIKKQAAHKVKEKQSLPMRPHRQHDGFAHKGDVGKEVVTLVAELDGVAGYLGGLQDVVLHTGICEMGGRAGKESGA